MQLKWQLATVAEKIQETKRAYSIGLNMPEWSPHKAGQHVDVRLTAEDGYQAQRSYSIASPPEDKLIWLTVERLEDGEVSTYLTGELRVGDLLELRGPIGGYFTWDESGAEEKSAPLFLVAGGSGIVPLMAMIRHRARAKNRTPARLLYSARSWDDVIYRAELEELARAGDGFDAIYTLTREQPENWTGYKRRIDRAMLEEVMFLLDQKANIFVCGPTPLVEAVADFLQQLGNAPERIKTERFGPTGG